MLPYEVAVEIDDDGITIDLTDAPPTQPGPVNSPRVGVISAIRCAMMALAIHDGRANEGYFRPLELKTRPGSMFDAERPAPCALASYPLYILIEGINEAIAQAAPEQMPCGFDMCVSLVMWGNDESGKFWADSINVVGGAPAAGSYGDGGGPLMPIACSGMRGVSWEVWEAKTPMVIESADYAPDSSGAGRYRGGPGIDLVREGAAPTSELTVVNERSQVPPFALAGGEKGRRSHTIVHRPGGEPRGVREGDRAGRRQGRADRGPDQRRLRLRAGRRASHRGGTRRRRRRLSDRGGGAPALPARLRLIQVLRGTSMPSRIGVDVGGTFTDLIFLDEETGQVTVGKGPSNPSAVDQAVQAVVADSVGEAGLGRADYFLHGTTVGLNALLERKGARVGILTTEGFRDVLEVRRLLRFDERR